MIPLKELPKEKDLTLLPLEPIITGLLLRSQIKIAPIFIKRLRNMNPKSFDLSLKSKNLTLILFPNSILITRLLKLSIRTGITKKECYNIKKIWTKSSPESILTHSKLTIVSMTIQPNRGLNTSNLIKAILITSGRELIIDTTN